MGLSMDHWNELRTAYIVARTGTISAAAQELDVHRATVVRHIDVLESALGGPLFHRHRRGYDLTAAGEDLLGTATIVDEQLEQLARRTRGRTLHLQGELTVTALALFTPVILDVAQDSQREHPELQIRYEVGSRVLRLDRGEAHVALRVGTRPTHPDEVVQPLPDMTSSLYGSADYLARHGRPTSREELGQHAFVADRNEAPLRWLEEQVHDARIVFSSPESDAAFAAISSGIGLGLVPDFLARRLGLTPLFPGPARGLAVWIVTHHRMHRSARVRWVSAQLRDRLVAELDPVHHRPGEER